MSMKCDFDPCSKRWYACLPDEPGRPRIEADSPEILEAFLASVEEEAWKRAAKQAAK